MISSWIDGKRRRKESGDDRIVLQDLKKSLRWRWEDYNNIRKFLIRKRKLTNIYKIDNWLDIYTSKFWRRNGKIALFVGSGNGSKMLKGFDTIWKYTLDCLYSFSVNTVKKSIPKECKLVSFFSSSSSILSMLEIYRKPTHPLSSSSSYSIPVKNVIPVKLLLAIFRKSREEKGFTLSWWKSYNCALKIWESWESFSHTLRLIRSMKCEFFITRKVEKKRVSFTFLLFFMTIILQNLMNMSIVDDNRRGKCNQADESSLKEDSFHRDLSCIRIQVPYKYMYMSILLFFNCFFFHLLHTQNFSSKRIDMLNDTPNIYISKAFRSQVRW